MYVPCTMRGTSVLGIMWRTRIRGKLAPVALDASTYICSRRLNTTARTTRTTRGISGMVRAINDILDTPTHQSHQGNGQQNGRNRHHPVHDTHHHRIHVPMIAAD